MRGHYSNALQAASFKRHDRIVEMLLANGATVKALSSAIDLMVMLCRLLLQEGMIRSSRCS